METSGEPTPKVVLDTDYTISGPRPVDTDPDEAETLEPPTRGETTRVHELGGRANLSG